MRSLVAVVLILVAGGAQGQVPYSGPGNLAQDMAQFYGQVDRINRQQDLEYYQYESLRQQRRTNQLLARQARALERARYVPQHRPPVDVYPNTCIVGCTLSK